MTTGIGLGLFNRYLDIVIPEEPVDDDQDLAAGQSEVFVPLFSVGGTAFETSGISCEGITASFYHPAFKSLPYQVDGLPVLFGGFEGDRGGVAGQAGLASFGQFKPATSIIDKSITPGVFGEGRAQTAFLSPQAQPVIIGGLLPEIAYHSIEARPAGFGVEEPADYYDLATAFVQLGGNGVSFGGCFVLNGNHDPAGNDVGFGGAIVLPGSVSAGLSEVLFGGLYGNTGLIQFAGLSMNSGGLECLPGLLSCGMPSIVFGGLKAEPSEDASDGSDLQAGGFVAAFASLIVGGRPASFGNAPAVTPIQLISGADITLISGEPLEPLL
ncbi:MAG: hypothetical protein ACRBBN_15135 [Methyloligellaceae bacterium]